MLYFIFEIVSKFNDLILNVTFPVLPLQGFFKL